MSTDIPSLDEQHTGTPRIQRPDSVRFHSDLSARRRVPRSTVAEGPSPSDSSHRREFMSAFFEQLLHARSGSDRSHQLVTSQTTDLALSSGANVSTDGSATRVPVRPPTLSSASMFKYAHNARHTVFWYHDGSVVLVLEDMLFKLHASRLERESKYFADLFRGDPPQETMEGCPAYIVHGVSAADFTVLVETMEGAITYARSPPPFPVAAALLRASRALSFYKFTEFAVQVLHEMWSPDLKLVTSERKPYAADTIDLAAMCDVPEVLKRAYYELLRTPRFRQSVDGDDGNMRDDPSAPSTLGVLDYERLVAARSKLQDAWLQIALVPFGSDCPPRALPLGSEPADVRPYQSGESAQLWHKMVVQKPVFKEGMLDPLGALQTLIDIDWCELCYCKSCVGRQRKTWTEARERIWRDLDAWLGLG